MFLGCISTGPSGCMSSTRRLYGHALNLRFLSDKYSFDTMFNTLRSQTLSALRSSRVIAARPCIKSPFSTSAHRSLMDLAGFSDEQLTVKEAISNICSQFPNTYWQERDQQERDPKEFHAALAKDGWLGIALPEELGGAGLGG